MTIFRPDGIIMKKILSFLLILLPILSGAEIVPENKARAIAEAFLQQPHTKSAKIQLELVHSSLTKTPELPVLYLYDNKAGDGFVLVAGDDVASPVLGYSLSGHASAGQLPPSFSYWIDFLTQEINWARKRQMKASARIRSRWATFEPAQKGGFPVTGLNPGKVIKEYVTARWDQDQPFWNECPVHHGKHSYSGCLITAAAIVMRYQEWPDRGVGVSQQYRTKGKITVPSRNLEHDYDWKSMPLSYADGRYTDYSGQQVADLMADLGAILKAEYGTEGNSGTGAYIEDLPSALAKHMKYDKSIHLERRDFNLLKDWIRKIKAELGRTPIVYGGVTENFESGHAFVLDGYTDQDFFHVNWGWSGISNGWFLLTALDPDQQGAGGSDSGYNARQNAVFNMYKDDGGQEVEQISMMAHTVTDGGRRAYNGIWTSEQHWQTGRKSELGAGVFYNEGSHDFVGDLALAVVDRFGMVRQILMEESFSEAEPMDREHYYWMPDQWVTIYVELQTGDRIISVFKSKDATEWTPVQYPHEGGFVGEILLVEEFDPDASLEHSVSLSYDRLNEEVYISIAPTVEVHLMNSAGEDLTSRCVRTGNTVTIDGSALEKGTYRLIFRRGEEEKTLKMTF